MKYTSILKTFLIGFLAVFTFPLWTFYLIGLLVKDGLKSLTEMEMK